MTFKEHSKLIFCPQKFCNMLLCSCKENFGLTVSRLILGMVNSIVWHCMNLKYLFDNTSVYQLSMATKMLCNKQPQNHKWHTTRDTYFYSWVCRLTHGSADLTWDQWRQPLCQQQNIKAATFSDVSEALTGKFGLVWLWTHVSSTSGIAWECSRGEGRRAREETKMCKYFFKSLLASSVFLSNWPKQVTWLESE